MPIIGFDHFIVVVAKLDAAMNAYRRLGFSVSPGGAHPAFGSHNALIALADGTYIELVAFTDEALAAQSFWSEAYNKLQAGEGFCGFVVASDDIGGDVRQLRARGVEIADPQPGARTRPDGQQVAWHTAIMRQRASGALPFLIQDETPRELRIAPPATGLGLQARAAEVTLIVDHLDQTLQDYAALLDVQVPGSVEPAGYRLNAPCGSIVLIPSSRMSSESGDGLERRGEGFYSLTLSVKDLPRALRDASELGLRMQDDADGFVLPPDQACGARIRFVSGD